jgi:two-component system, cell cycle sensor histidine kinase and response regulator CckA
MSTPVSFYPLHVRCAVVAGLTACALVAAHLLKPIFDPGYFLPFLAAVLAATWFCERVAGAVTMVITAGCAAYFFDPPDNAIAAGRLAGYVLSAAAVSYLASLIRERTVRLERTLASIGDGVISIDRNGCVEFLNPVAEGMVGWTLARARKKPLDEVLKLVEDKTGEPLELPTGLLLQEGRVFRTNREKILISRDGHKVWVEESGAPIRDHKGRGTGAILVFRDVTARREAQDHASQSQKMDAVGRLARGAAGDFNNLLTVITGFSEMLRTDLEEGNHLRRFADEIYLAADRAAGLTRQLLALGQKQAGYLKLQDLNALVCSMETMLRRLLGAKIELVIVQGSGKVKADAAQMEQVIVNLAMNSRDAMPQGGKFVIEISNMEIEEGGNEKWPGLQPGSYVTLVVSDTGTGMDAETRAHLFEPFFTTKTKGKGTGLGLSIVYGIVQQSGGYINVYSQLGSGTVFEIFLPRQKGSTKEFLVAGPRPKKRGSETVLVADDEDGVRKLVHAVLATNGYNVLEARDGAEALALYAANRAQVDMVVTDIVMPHMTGLELGDRLNQLDTRLRVLYISGYRDSPIGGVTEERERIFLHKPFTPDQLLTKVRELLDKPASPSVQGTQA